MKEYKRSQEELDRKRKKLEYNIKEKIFSNSIKLFKTQLLKQKEHISSIKIEKPVLKINEEELRHIIQTQKQNKNTKPMEQHEVKSGVSKPMNPPEPIVQSVKKAEHWSVQVVSGYTLALSMVSSLALFYTLLTTSVFASSSCLLSLFQFHPPHQSA